ncbi:MAG: DEAD/DEAH box helicase [Deltaproteobacteria bacterium]|nr:DEAD/DEAH box helicase [Deltaproteobacteria bacterium]
MRFADLGLDARLLAALSELGYEEPTPIQQAAIPALLEGRDLLGQAATGTGKTAAFALPILHRLLTGEPAPRQPRSARALILVPTRELAMQVVEATQRYGKALAVRAVAVFGGQPIGPQLKALSPGVDVVVATPGRALDHIRRKSLLLGGVEVVVLDEADEMLDMGFAEELEAVLKELPATRQTALLSATMPKRIAEIAARHLKDPVELRLAREVAPAGALPRVRQTAYMTYRPQKMATLVRLLEMETPALALVFCRTRIDVDVLGETLTARGIPAEPLHGGLSQEQRERALRRFKEGAAPLLVATDVAARGLDVRELSHVINYDLPSSPEDYVHRIGRTGRAGRAGVAITLLEPRELRLLGNIESLTKQKIELGVVPTVEALEAHRLAATQAALREALKSASTSTRYHELLAALTVEHSVQDIALAALRLYHASRGGERVEPDIPTPPPPRPPGAARPQPTLHGAKVPRARSAGGARLFVGAGFLQGIRPADLVGAISNETGLPGRSIGAIEITERFSLVELPAEAVDEVVARLQGKLIKGKKVMVRRDRDRAGETPAPPRAPGAPSLLGTPTPRMTEPPRPGGTPPAGGSRPLAARPHGAPFSRPAGAPGSRRLPSGAASGPPAARPPGARPPGPRGPHKPYPVRKLGKGHPHKPKA